jgi:hypothetical protein
MAIFLVKEASPALEAILYAVSKYEAAFLSFQMFLDAVPAP